MPDRLAFALRVGKEGALIVALRRSASVFRLMLITAYFLSFARVTPLALVLCGLGSTADAHPHVWISTRSEIVFDKDQKLSAIRQTWTFDQEYTAYAVLGLDSRRDHQPDPDKLSELAQTNVAALAEWNWYTGLKVNGAKVDFAPPIEATPTYADGRLTLSFLLPLNAPVLVKTMFVKTDDPTFYVAFNLADGPDPIRMINAPTGCTMKVQRPLKPAAEGVQIVDDAVAETRALSKNAASIGADFIPRVMVACP